MDEMMFPVRVRDNAVEDALINLALCTGIRQHHQDPHTSLAFMVGGHQYHIAMSLEQVRRAVADRP